MSLEPNSELNNVTPLSKAHINRRPNNKLSDITEARLRDILDEVLESRLIEQNRCLSEQNQHLTKKLERIETSINRVVKQFDAIRNGEAEDAALRVTTDCNATDIVLAGISLPKEEYYPYTCALLAEELNIPPHHVQRMIKIFELKGNTDYHLCIRTGKKGETHKYSEQTLQRLKQALESEEYSIPTH